MSTVDALVTGAAGFLGSHLVEDLANEGCRVRALVRPSSDTAPLEPLDVEIMRGDVTNPEVARHAVRGCRAVYHLAAARSHDVTREAHYATNVQGTKCLAGAALEAGVARFVYAGSAGVYGTISEGPINEDSPLAPNSHYRRSKLLAENALSVYQDRGLAVVTARIASAYGPRSANWVGLFRAVASGRFRIVGNGMNHVQMGYVSDIVQGVRLCGDVPGIEGRRYLIAGSEALALRRFVEIVAEDLGVTCAISSVPAPPFKLLAGVYDICFRVAGIELPRADVLDLHLSDRRFDISRAQAEIGYVPRVDLRHGVRETLAWCRSQGLL
jgi:nucleoside-diphosphate-sugar epimerase